MSMQERRPLVIHHEMMTEELTIKGNDDPLARKIHGETWPLRRAEFARHREPRMHLPEISMANWLAMVNDVRKPSKFLVFIDGHYMHATVVNKLGLSMNFHRFRDNLRGAMLPIEYYSMGSLEQCNSSVQDFLILLSNVSGFNVNLKPFRELLHGEEDLRTHEEMDDILRRFPVLRSSWGTFAPEMSVQMAYLLNEYPEEVNDVLLFTRDSDMLAAVRNARSYGVRVTLVRCPDVPINNELLGEANYVLHMRDVLHHLKCGYRRHG